MIVNRLQAYLVSNVIPVMLASKLLEILLQKRSHLDDSIGHALNLAKPLLVQLGVLQDLAGNTGTVDGRIGVQRTDEDLDLGVEALLLFCAIRNNAEGTHSLTVETHVLCK